MIYDTREVDQMKEGDLVYSKEHMTLLLTAHDAFYELKEVLQVVNRGREDEGILAVWGR